MNAADRHLIATDLDDTIVSDLFSLNTASVRKLMELQEAGHVVMIATARPTCLALPYYRLLGLKSLLSTVNGNYLYHPDDPSVPMIRHELSLEQMDSILGALDAAGIRNGWMHSDDSIRLVGEMPDHPYFKLMFSQSRVELPDRLPLLPCGRLMVTADCESRAREAQEKLASCPGMHCTLRGRSSGGWDMVITPDSADKWHTVREAAAYYGVDEKNIWCFGDENNDRMMVMNAAHGYAMVNGNPGLVADMRALGKGVTRLPCDQGGVADILKQLL